MASENQVEMTATHEPMESTATQKPIEKTEADSPEQGQMPVTETPVQQAVTENPAAETPNLETSTDKDDSSNPKNRMLPTRMLVLLRKNQKRHPGVLMMTM